MKNKIVGILVCMLLIATAVPAVTSIKNNLINATVPSTPLTSNAGSWNVTQKIIPSDGATLLWFGWAVSLDGDTALIGSDEYTSGNGSAYVFIRTGNTWTQQAKLIASDGANNDEFGWSVSLDGDTALIGAMYDDEYGTDSGSAYVFTRTGTTWTQQAKLLPAVGAAGAQFGISVSLENDTALIGANRDDNNGVFSGSAYVFTRMGTTWTQQAKLLASDGEAEDRFGISVSLSGDTALIGSEDGDNGANSGSAYVFTRTGTNWTFGTKLHASDAATGDAFGYSVSLSGDTALIGAWLDDDNGVDSGSAYVFTRTGFSWNQQAKLLPSNGTAGDHFSSWSAVCLDGDTALIGAIYGDGTVVNSGSAYVFTRTDATWTEQTKLFASDGATADNFGVSVALDGDTALLGVPRDDDNGVDSGSAYVFTKTADLTFSISGGLGIWINIKNNGTANVSGVEYLIHVEGGILGRINKTVNGTIDIPAGLGVTISVGTGIFFGLGPITITAKLANEEKTVTGKQFIILSIVK